MQSRNNSKLYNTSSTKILINGIPPENLQGKIYKIPKGYKVCDSSSKFFKTSYVNTYSQEVKERAENLVISEPNDVKELLKLGVIQLVNNSNHYKPVVQMLFDNNNGYQICVHYENIEGYKYSHILLSRHQIFAKYNDAQEYINEILHKRRKIANISDEEWNKNNIVDKLDNLIQQLGADDG